MTEYVLDRNVAYTTILAANDTIRVYEDNTLLQTNDMIEVTGLNETVVASVEGSTVESYRYDDYGQSESTQGHGYNGEVKDETGLIYLRARYYDPDMGRFIQIDNNYGGEKEEVVTQNRYTYTLNNPYKYVDRDGNRVLNENAESGSNYNPSTGANEIQRNGYMPAKWLQECKSKTALSYKINTSQIPDAYRADALTYWSKRNNYSKNDNRMIRLKPSQQQKHDEGQDDQKITGGDDGDGGVLDLKKFRDISIGITECPSDEIDYETKIQNMTISQKLVNYLGYKEGKHYQSYDSLEGGTKTIGIGHKFANYQEQAEYEGRTISEEEITNFLRGDLLGFTNRLKEELIIYQYVPTQWEFDGITSFIFNVGPNAGHTTNAVNYVKNKDWAGLRSFFDTKTTAGGVQLPGLVSRRNEEYEIITTGQSAYYK